MLENSLLCGNGSSIPMQATQAKSPLSTSCLPSLLPSSFPPLSHCYTMQWSKTIQHYQLSSFVNSNNNNNNNYYYYYHTPGDVHPTPSSLPKRTGDPLPPLLLLLPAFPPYSLYSSSLLLLLSSADSVTGRKLLWCVGHMIPLLALTL